MFEPILPVALLQASLYNISIILLSESFIVSIILANLDTSCSDIYTKTA